MSGIGGTIVGMLSEFDEVTPSRAMVKVTKKVVSIIGFLFGIDQSYGGKFWN